MAELGSALVLTDEDLDRLAEITEEDVVQTNISWTSFASRWAKNLLLAEGPYGTKGEE